jgi:NADPH-dependent 2,4-dienoyl-CoA reductase/sulfur reductase-like enzyme
MRIVVIGGVAAGMSAASQAKRRRPDAEVVVLERGPHVSYGACGLPYNIADPERRIDDLVVISAERFRRERNIDVRTRHDALAIDTAKKIVRVRDLAAERDYEIHYDRLVLATGAAAVRPPLPGIDSPGVFVLRELTDGAAVKRWLAENPVRRAVIIGAGYIGMEMAEALRTRGLEVVVLEKLGQVVPGFDPALAGLIEKELVRNGVRVETGVAVTGIERKGDELVVRTERDIPPTDLVLVSVGVRPSVALARAADIQLGPTGAIAVDDHMRTSAPDVFAAGDCAEATHLVTGAPAWVPLGSTANKQGKVAGANAAGADERFPGIVGTAAFKVFDLEVGRTGLGSAELERLGMVALRSLSTHRTRGHGYPGSTPVTTVLFVERHTGHLLGAQMVGGEGVAGRIDVLATALHARMTVAQIESLDLAYAPPLAPVYDPVLIAAGVARKDLQNQRVPDATIAAGPSA